MEEYDGPIFDCDNHYYEAHDAFTRHVPEHMQPRCVQWVELENGRKYHVVAGNLSFAVGNPTFNPISKPGALREYYYGNPRGKKFGELIRESLEPMPSEYMDRNKRVERLEEQGLEAAWLFPTAGVLYEEPLSHDTDALCAATEGFNRWLNDDWKLNYKEDPSDLFREHVWISPFWEDDIASIMGADRVIFGSGYDVGALPARTRKGITQYRTGRGHEDDTWLIEQNNRKIRMLWEMHKPSIAQIHGACMAGGTDLAMACDMVIAADDARFGFPAARSFGALPNNLWIYHCGPQWGKRLQLTGDLISGADAEKIGLSLKAVPADALEDEVQGLADRLALIDTDLLAANKRIINLGLELMGAQTLQRLAAENDVRARHATAVPEPIAVSTSTGSRKPCVAGTNRSVMGWPGSESPRVDSIRQRNRDLGRHSKCRLGERESQWICCS